MARRADGRVEPGQRLSSGFSARAWNRAQEAADRVLGAVPGLYAGSPILSTCALYVQVYLQTPLENDLTEIGYAFKITSFGGPSGGGPSIDYVYGELAMPVDLRGGETDSTVLPVVFGVSVEPKKAGAKVILCAISGLCKVKLHMTSPSHRYACLPTKRSSSSIAQPGVLESSDTGYAVLINSSPAMVKL